MSQIKTLNGVQYTLPQYSDTGWGANTGNVLTQYLAAIADVTLQLSGGSFTLTAETDFGSNFGLKALYLKTETANPASAGVVRLGKTDSIGWRNNANSADKLLSIDGSDNLQYASTKVLLSGAVVNADINASAAIAYSKLALTGSIVNADIANAAGIAYSKLTLTGSIVNADIASGAAIAYSKLNLTGSIVNGDITAGTITNAAINASAAIAYSKLSLTGSIVDADINASAAVALSKLGTLSGISATLGTITSADTIVGALGKIINARVVQVVFSTTTTAFTTGSATAQTAQSLSITPKSTSNKVLIIAFGSLTSNSSAQTGFGSLYNGSTNLASGTNYMAVNTTGQNDHSGFMMWLDSPASTSAQTYNVKIWGDGAHTTGWGINASGQLMMLAIEIGA